MRLISILVAFIPVLVACAQDNTSRTETIAQLTADTTSGKSLYESNCMTCHGADGHSGTAKADIVHEAQDERNNAILKVLIGEGDDMPEFGSKLTDQEVADIVGYVASIEHS